MFECFGPQLVALCGKVVETLRDMLLLVEVSHSLGVGLEQFFESLMYVFNEF